jgi:lipopolysaccharide biosynthesis protein
VANVSNADAALGHAWPEATRQALMGAAAHAAPIVAKPQQPCAVIHAWYPDVFDEILGTLQATNLPWRILVSTTSGKESEIQDCLLKRGMQAEIRIFENRGRDILPFLHVANQLLDEGIDVVLKLHTKRSLHRADGDDWRRELVSRLASPDRAARILRAFDEDESLGVVGPEGHLQRLETFWGGNADAVQYVAARIGMLPPGQHDPFVAGSMFWVRLESIRDLLDARLFGSEFEQESGQLDGTLSHAVERLFAACASHSGFRVEDATAISRIAPQDSSTTKPRRTIKPGGPGMRT